MGRLLTDDDLDAGAGNEVCVISYALWQGRFVGDPHILGRKLMLSAHPYTVVGVTEKGFFGPQLHSRIDLQIPLSRAGDFMSGPFVTMWKSADFSWLEPLARLKPEVSRARAQAMIEALARALRVETVAPDVRARVEKTSFRLSDGSQGVNVNEHLLSKPVTILHGRRRTGVAHCMRERSQSAASSRRGAKKEFAVRLSLGASRPRLVRQLMVESIVQRLRRWDGWFRAGVFLDDSDTFALHERRRNGRYRYRGDARSDVDWLFHSVVARDGRRVWLGSGVAIHQS